MIINGITLLLAGIAAGCGIYTVKRFKKLLESAERAEGETVRDKEKERIERQWDALMTYDGGNTNGRNDTEE